MRRFVMAFVFAGVAVAVAASTAIWLRHWDAEATRKGDEFARIAKQADVKPPVPRDESSSLSDVFQTVELDVFHDGGELETNGRYSLNYETFLVEVSSGHSFRLKNTLAWNIELTEVRSSKDAPKHSIVASMPTHVAALVEYAKPRGHFGLYRNLGRMQNDPLSEDRNWPIQMNEHDLLDGLKVDLDRIKIVERTAMRLLIHPAIPPSKVRSFEPIDAHDIKLRPSEIAPWDVARQSKYVPCATCAGGKKLIGGSIGENANANPRP